MAKSKFTEILERIEIAAEDRRRAIELTTAKIVEFAELVRNDLGAPAETIRISDGTGGQPFPMDDFRANSEAPKDFTIYLAISTEEGVKRRAVRIELDTESDQQILLDAEPYSATSLTDLRLAEAVADKLAAAFASGDPLKEQS